MFSSSSLCLTGAAVCPRQRSHRGHGGSHPEDMPEHQWPQTWGEQQSVSTLPSESEQMYSVTLQHFCSSSLKSSLVHASHSSFVLLPLLPPLPFLQFSCSSTRWLSAVPQTCSNFMGSSCLCSLWKLQALKGTWRQWRSTRARSPSRRSSWWR